MLTLFLILFASSALAQLNVAEYRISITDYSSTYDKLIIFGTTPGYPILTTQYLPKSEVSEDAIWLDVSTYPMKLYLYFTSGSYGPYFIFYPGFAYYNVDLNFADSTFSWNITNLRRGTNILNRGKYKLQGNSYFTYPARAHGILETGTEGFVQGAFPVCDPDYSLTIAYVNNNGDDPTYNTLSCDYVTCNSYQTTSSKSPLTYSSSSLYLTANKGAPTKISGLSNVVSNQVYATCPNDGTVNNIYYAPTSYWNSVPSLMQLYVIDPSTNLPVYSGKTQISHNADDPPTSQPYQASLNMGLSYPSAIFADAL